MRTLAPLEDGAFVEKGAEVLAKGLKVLGFTQDYAPVLDVDTNPANPVIGDRSFSRDPEVVARLGARFIRAMQAHGVAACGKHFPGHGDTHQDSHHELPWLDHDLARLLAVELVPFRAAIEAEVASIMTAHVLFPALDPDHPATLSEKIIAPLLRDRLGYQGVIVSDDLEMKAVADHYGIEDSVVRAVRSGCDQLLICHTHELQVRAKEALIHAVENGSLPRARLLEASARVLEMKRKYPPQMVASSAQLMAALPPPIELGLG
jgi:beta-N-acetylhexosaminidase